jgi:hypothetical protein
VVDVSILIKFEFKFLVFMTCISKLPLRLSLDSINNFLLQSKLWLGNKAGDSGLALSFLQTSIEIQKRLCGSP